MKILMICDFFHESQVYHENFLYKYYIKNNHTVTIVCSTFTSVFDYYSGNYNNKKEQNEYYYENCKIIRTPYSINVLNKLRKFKNLKSIIEGESPDLIYVHSMALNLFESVYYKKKHKNCKLIFDSHADYSNSAKSWISYNILHKIIYKSVLQIFYSKIDKIYYITPNCGSFLNKTYGTPFSKMSILPLGVDVDYIKSIQKKNTKNKIRKNLNIGLDDFVIFTGGKLKKDKKTNLLIEAFNQIKNDSIHLLIIGETTDEMYKKELLELIGLNSRIHYMGWIEGKHMYEYMMASNLGVFPAKESVLWQHTIGVGLPLIVGKSKGQDPTYLNINNCMFIIEEQNVTKEELNRLILQIYSDKRLYLNMKESAQKTSNEFLSYDKIVEETLN